MTLKPHISIDLDGTSENPILISLEEGVWRIIAEPKRPSLVGVEIDSICLSQRGQIRMSIVNRQKVET